MPLVTVYEQIRTLLKGAEEEHEATFAAVTEARDKASTSYRQGYEAGIKAEAEARAKKEVADLQDRAALDVQVRAVLASNPLDPKALNVWEMADILASLTASMRALADALVEANETAQRRRAEWWTAVGEADQLREQLRLLTRERDEWREEAMAFRREGAPTSLR